MDPKLMDETPYRCSQLNAAKLILRRHFALQQFALPDV